MEQVLLLNWIVRDLNTCSRILDLISLKRTILRTTPWSHAIIHEMFVLSQSFTHASDSKDLIHFFDSKMFLTVNIWTFWILIPYIRPSDKINFSQSNCFFDSHYFVTSWISLGLEWEISQTLNNAEVTMMHNNIIVKWFLLQFWKFLHFTLFFQMSGKCELYASILDLLCTQSTMVYANDHPVVYLGHYKLRI